MERTMVRKYRYLFTGIMIIPVGMCVFCAMTDNWFGFFIGFGCFFIFMWLNHIRFVEQQAWDRHKKNMEELFRRIEESESEQ
jgi:hypothetical protein